MKSLFIPLPDNGTKVKRACILSVMRQRKAGWKPNNFIAIFATFLVVGGIVAIAFVAAPRLPVQVSPSGTSSTVPTDGYQTTTMPLSIVTDAQGADMLRSEAQRHDLPFWAIQGVDIQTGEPVSVDENFKRNTSGRLHSPDGKRVAYVLSPKTDGTGSLGIKTKQIEQVLALRLKDGSGLHDAKILGWWDNQTVAFSALATSTRSLYVIDIQGIISEIAALPQYIERLRVTSQDESVHYVTVTPGQGIEQPDTPPSEIHAVSRGGDEVIVYENAAVIGNYAIGQQSFAYNIVDHNRIEWFEQGATGTLSFADAAPLMYLDDGSLVLRHGQFITAYNVKSHSEKILTPVASSTAIFFLHL